MHAATSRCSPRASACLSSSLTDSCHSSNSGQPRRVNPARKSSRYSEAARSSEAASGRPISALNSRTSTRTSAGSSATAARLMLSPSPIAAAVTDSVRRSDARPLALSASGQSRSASCSRLCSRPVTASSASSAVAFLVSKVTGAPSRLTTGGPSRARLKVRRCHLQCHAREP